MAYPYKWEIIFPILINIVVTMLIHGGHKALPPLIVTNIYHCRKTKSLEKEYLNWYS